MPNRSAHPCAEHGCNRLVMQGSRCAEHRLLRAPDTRPSATARGYGYEWKLKFRDPYLKEHPWCVNPFGLHGTRVPAVVVNHKTPKAQGGKDEWTNFEGLCRRCDNKQHYYDGSKGVGGRKSFDGSARPA